MYQYIGECEFMDGLRNLGFSYNGVRTLYRWYDEYEDSLGHEVEYCPCTIVSDWSEYESPCGAVRELISPDAIEEDGDDEAAIAMLEERTTVVRVVNWANKPTGNILVMTF